MPAHELYLRRLGPRQCPRSDRRHLRRRLVRLGLRDLLQVERGWG